MGGDGTEKSRRQEKAAVIMGELQKNLARYRIVKKRRVMVVDTGELIYCGE